MITLLTLTLALAGQGPGYHWSGTVAEGKQVSVKNIIGDIRVEPSTGRRVEIVAVKTTGKHGRAEDVEIRRVETAGGIEVCVIYPGTGTDDGDCDWSSHDDRGRGNSERNDTRVAFTLKVPSGISLQVHTVAGDVLVRGARGDVSAASVSGDVELSDVTAGSLEAQTVSGDVTLRGIDAAEVEAQTVSGDVIYQGQIRARGDYSFQTLSGDVELLIPAATNAEVSGSTFSGSIRSDLPITSTASGRRGSRKRISGTLGTGRGAEMNLESFSGNVQIRALP
ncbi:MAG: DUF4097 family beta strand repeat-containing protein [Gemmatimonadota bacterium]